MVATKKKKKSRKSIPGTGKFRLYKKTLDVIYPFYVQGMTAWATSNARLINKHGKLVKMPDERTVRRYFQYLNERQIDEMVPDLADHQRMVKARFISVFTDIIGHSIKERDDLVSYKYSRRADWPEEEPYVPDHSTERLILNYNDLIARQQAARFAVESMPIVDQFDDRAMLIRIEEEGRTDLKKSLRELKGWKAERKVQ